MPTFALPAAEGSRIASLRLILVRCMLVITWESKNVIPGQTELTVILRMPPKSGLGG